MYGSHVDLDEVMLTYYPLVGLGPAEWTPS
jgi:hypothetical protein